MTEEQRNGWRIVGSIVVFILAVWVVSKVVEGLKDPLAGKTPIVLADLIGAKTICENRVRDLKAAGIDGKAAYEAAQVEVNSCIGYLKGVLDSQGEGDRDKIKARLEKTASACNRFQWWADEKLAKGGVGTVKVDLADCLDKIIKILTDQEQQRRQRVKASLDECRFRAWSEIPAGIRAVK